MSTNMSNELQNNVELRVSASLIRRCGLSAETIVRISNAERMLGVRFCDAALRLGIVSQDDVDAAQAGDGKMELVKKKALPDQKLSIAHDPYARRSEGIRALRTELLLRRDGIGQADVIAILSPCASEGRSQLAAELAISFAQLGSPTLLVDADLRRSGQQDLFTTDNHHGLSDAIAHGTKPLLHAVEGLPQMTLLTSGPVQPNPLELLSDGHFSKLLDEWRQRYTYVIFDTSPVSLYSDGLAVAKLAGRVLALSRAGHTPYQETGDLLRRLAATQSQILGAVINHF